MKVMNRPVFKTSTAVSNSGATNKGNILRFSIFATIVIFAVTGCKKDDNGGSSNGQGQIEYLQYKQKLDDGSVNINFSPNNHSIRLEYTYKNGYKAEVARFFLTTSSSTLTSGTFTYGAVNPEAGNFSVSSINYDIDGLGASATLLGSHFSSGTFNLKKDGNTYDISVLLQTTSGNTVKVSYKGLLRESL